MITKATSGMFFSLWSLCTQNYLVSLCEAPECRYQRGLSFTGVTVLFIYLSRRFLLDFQKIWEHIEHDGTVSGHIHSAHANYLPCIAKLCPTKAHFYAHPLTTVFLAFYIVSWMINVMYHDICHSLVVKKGNNLLGVQHRTVGNIVCH